MPISPHQKWEAGQRRSKVKFEFSVPSSAEDDVVVFEKSDSVWVKYTHMDDGRPYSVPIPYWMKTRRGFPLPGEEEKARAVMAALKAEIKKAGGEIRISPPRDGSPFTINMED